MARVPYLTIDDLAPEDHDLLARDITLYKALANSPGAARNFRRLGNYIRHESPLDPRLRELAILQVGYLARAAYEYSHHIKIGRDFGLSDDDIRAVAAETEGRETALAPLARAVLRAAREMSTGLAVTDATFAELEAGLECDCLVDLIVTIGFYNGVVRILESLQIDVEDEYLPYLEEFPLPEEPHAS